MRLRNFTVCLFVLSALGAKAQIGETINIDSVVVTGTMSRVATNYLPMSISVVSGAQLASRYNSSLLPALSEEVSGLFITARGVMGYGVSTGAAGAMSMRGIGGSTNGVLVLVDGQPQYMGLMGHALPDAYESAVAERVEVVRGPASVIYGSNAMAGVINIITKKQTEDGSRTRANVMYGSYNTTSVNANNAYRHGRFNSFVSLGYNRTDGHRLNSGFEQYSGAVKLGYDISKRWAASVNMNITQYDVANPGTVAVPMIDNDMDVLRLSSSLVLSNDYGRTHGAAELFYNRGRHKIDDGYKFNGRPQDMLYRSTDDMWGVRLHQTFNLFRGNDITAGVDYSRYGGDAWNESVATGERTDIPIGERYLNQVAGYVNINQTFAERWTLNFGLRADNNEQTGTHWIPQAGLTYRAGGQTVLKAVVSKGFRNPTIKEMYMFKPQNAELKPEELVNYEIGATQSLMDRALRLDLNLFYLDASNLIQMAMEGGQPLNVNTGEAKNCGLEFASSYRFNRNWTVAANYSYLHMKNPLLASPEHQLYVSGRFAQKRWDINAGVQYIDGLYTSVAQNALQTESYVSVNLRATYNIFGNFDIFVKAENLLDQTYENYAGFTMPGITFFGGISIAL